MHSSSLSRPFSTDLAAEWPIFAHDRHCMAWKKKKNQIKESHSMAPVTDPSQREAEFQDGEVIKHEI